MSVKPSLVNLPVTYVTANTYNIPSYLGYINATPTADAIFTLPSRQSYSEGSWVQIKNQSAYTITVKENSTTTGVIQANGVGEYISGDTWIDYSVTAGTPTIPTNLNVPGYVNVGSTGPPTNTSAGDLTWLGEADGDISNATVNVGDTTRILNNKLSDIVSVKDFGAVGDGTTNDYDSFKTAIDTVKVNGGGLYVPTGTYLLTATNNTSIIPYNITLYGDGKGISTVIFKAATTDEYIALVVGSNVTFRNLTLRINSSTTVSTSVIKLMSINDAYVTNDLNIINCDLDGSKTIQVFSTPTSYGLTFGNGSGKRYNITNCDIHNFVLVFYNTNASTGTATNFNITNNRFYNNFNTDLAFNAPNSNLTDILIANNTFENNLGYVVSPQIQSSAISLASAKRIRVSNNNINGIYLANAIHLEENTIDFVIDGNIIIIDGSGISSQENNVNTANTSFVPQQGSITNNVIENKGTTSAPDPRSGIDVVFNAGYASFASGKRIVIANNVVRGAFTYGYRIAAYDDDCILLTNNIASSCTNGYAIIGNCFNADKNLSDTCITGIQFIEGGGSVLTHRWNNCTNNIYTNAIQLATIAGAIFTMPKFDIGAGATVQFPLFPIDLYDRLNMQTIVNCYRGNDLNAYYFDLTWDGSSITANTTSSSTIGSLVVTFSNVDDFLSLNITSASAQTGVTLRTSLQGFYVNRPGPIV